MLLYNLMVNPYLEYCVHKRASKIISGLGNLLSLSNNTRTTVQPLEVTGVTVKRPKEISLNQ